MSEVINCSICSKLFSFDSVKDSHLNVDLNNETNILSEYPVQDEMWPSRRWDKNKKEYIDLSGNSPICESCYVKRIFSKDALVDNHKVCSINGCANDSDGISNFCSECHSNINIPKK